jgi:hypothetical protein
MWRRTLYIAFREEKKIYDLKSCSLGNIVERVNLTVMCAVNLKAWCFYKYPLSFGFSGEPASG